MPFCIDKVSAVSELAAKPSSRMKFGRQLSLKLLAQILTRILHLIFIGRRATLCSPESQDHKEMNNSV